MEAKHVLNIKCWLCVWENTLDKGYAGTIATQKLMGKLSLTCCFHSTLHSCVYLCLFMYYAYPMKESNETLNFELKM